MAAFDSGSLQDAQVAFQLPCSDIPRSRDLGLAAGVTHQITQNLTLLIVNVLFNFQGTWDSDMADI